MEYISSDTNIWIDYMIINKLELPFRLSITYLINQDSIDDELLSPKGLKQKLIDLGLHPTELEEEEFYYGLKIAGLYPKLSQYDCSALAIAKCRGLVLLTGDAALRKVALSEGVSVMGTIGILDRLHKEKRITVREYRECLLSFIRTNGKEVRLPLVELQKRLDEAEKGLSEAKNRLNY